MAFKVGDRVKFLGSEAFVTAKWLSPKTPVPQVGDTGTVVKLDAGAFHNGLLVKLDKPLVGDVSDIRAHAPYKAGEAIVFAETSLEVIPQTVAKKPTRRIKAKA